MKKHRFFLYSAYGLEILIFYIFQGTPNFIPEFFGSKPLLLLPLAFTVSALEDEIPSAVFGAVCGILTDLGTGGFVGYYAILMTIICFFEAYIMKRYIVSGILTAFVFSAVATVLLVTVYFLIFFVMAGVENSGVYFVNHYISRIVYTFVLIIPLFYLNRFLHKSLY